MEFVEVARDLFIWNTQNLCHKADLKQSDLGRFFADRFQVKANGRVYDADHDSYFQFLNQFRSTIESIQYTFDSFIVSQNKVVIPMMASVTRIDGHLEKFEAILILKFNEKGKIALWHEVYVNF